MGNSAAVEQGVRNGRLRRVAMVGVAIGLAVIVPSCSGAGDDSASNASDSGGAADGGGGAISEEARPEGPAVGSQTSANRDVISVGDLTVRVPDVEEAADAANTIADKAGGFLADQQAELEGDREISMTLRVPSASFSAVMADVAELGRVQARRVTADEVTAEVVDLEGRLANARASAERLRTLLEDAGDVQQVVAIEDTLTQREAEIESIAGQLEVLQDQVALATVQVTFTEKDPPAVSDDLPGPLEALRSGVVALVTVLTMVLAVVAFAMPFLPFVAATWWLWRRWHRRHPKADRGQHLPAPPWAPPAAAEPWAGPSPRPGSSAGTIPGEGSAE